MPSSYRITALILLGNTPCIRRVSICIYYQQWITALSDISPGCSSIDSILMRNRKINSGTRIGVYSMEGTLVRNLESKSDLASPKIIHWWFGGQGYTGLMLVCTLLRFFVYIECPLPRVFVIDDWVWVILADVEAVLFLNSIWHFPGAVDVFVRYVCQLWNPLADI